MARDDVQLTSFAVSLVLIAVYLAWPSYVRPALPVSAVRVLDMLAALDYWLGVVLTFFGSALAIVFLFLIATLKVPLYARTIMTCVVVFTFYTTMHRGFMLVRHALVKA